MSLKIALRCHPFVHTYPVKCLIPKTPFYGVIYPCKLQIFHLLQESCLTEIDFPLQGPVRDFTVQQDLEKGDVGVWGKADKGYFHYTLKKEGEGVSLHAEKGLALKPIFVPPGRLQSVATQALSERLSLGVHKAQDWDRVSRHCDMAEIFPFWLKIARGYVIPEETLGQTGVPYLLKQCCVAVDKRQVNDVLFHFENLFRAGIEGLFTPRLEDTSFQGLTPPLHAKDRIHPLVLLKMTGDLIRRLFIEVHEEQVALLPLLPPQFHAGRFAGIEIEGVGTLDMEWSKKALRRCFIKATAEGPLQLKLPKQMRTFRLRSLKEKRGEKRVSSRPIFMQKGHTYLFDQFLD